MRDVNYIFVMKNSNRNNGREHDTLMGKKMLSGKLNQSRKKNIFLFVEIMLDVM